MHIPFSSYYVIAVLLLMDYVAKYVMTPLVSLQGDNRPTHVATKPYSNFMKNPSTLPKIWATSPSFMSACQPHSIELVLPKTI